MPGRFVSLAGFSDIIPNIFTFPADILYIVKEEKLRREDTVIYCGRGKLEEGETFY